MKKLTFLILLPVVLVSLSCKKKEMNHPSVSASKGDLMILVVSDDVECAMEYKKDGFYTSVLKKSPAYITAEFSNGKYNVAIYTPGVGLYGSYVQNVVGGFWAVDFPQFFPYYTDTFIDSIPGDQLKRNEVYTIPLDTSKVDFISFPYYRDKIEEAWDKVKNLRIVYEYRMKFPDSNIAFMRIEKEDGEAKSYFFMNKYKP